MAQRIQLAGIGPGVILTQAGTPFVKLHGHIYVYTTTTPVTIYSDATSMTTLSTDGSFSTDPYGRIPGWVDPISAIDIVIPPAPTITCILNADSTFYDPAGAAAAVQGNLTTEVSRAQAAEALLAPKASPSLTGTPTAPTATALDSSTKLATTAYSDAAVAVEESRALAGEATNGTAITTETTRATAAEALKAPLASPTLTGTPTAPTPAALDNSTKLGTTAYADAAVAVEVARAVAAEATKQATSAKGAANGYASLDSGGYVPLAQNSPAVVTGASAPLLDANLTSIVAPKGPITTPAQVPFVSGTFTAKAASVDLRAVLSSFYYGLPSGQGTFTLYVGPHGATPLARASQSGALTAGVQEIVVGAAPSLAADQRITGLVAGQQYDWTLTCAIVGYYWGFPIPETPVVMSSAVTLGLTGASPLNAGASFHEQYETIVAMASATKLHLLRSQHVSRASDYLTTGNGFALPVGRAGGGVAVSPDGNRVAVANYSLNTVTIYDISTAANMASPALVATVSTFASPSTVCWSPDGTTVYVAQFVSTGTCKWMRITTANATPVAGTQYSLDTTATNITSLSASAGYLLASGVNSGNSYVIKLADNTFSALGSVGAFSKTISDTVGYLMTNGVLNRVNPTTAAVTQIISDGTQVPDVIDVAAMDVQPDQNALFLFTRRATGQVFHLDLRTGQVQGKQYTRWPIPDGSGGIGAAVVGCINALGDFFVVTGTQLSVWPGGYFQMFGTNYGHAGSVRFTPAV